MNLPLTTSFDEVKKMTIEEDTLNKAIQDYSSKLAEQDIETWVIEHNMIVTEKGYYIALFAEEEQDFNNNKDKYIELCERTVKHLIGIIIKRKLHENFDRGVLNDALLIKNRMLNQKVNKQNDTT